MSERWCETCGQTLTTASSTATECQTCLNWWAANPPPLPETPKMSDETSRIVAWLRRKSQIFHRLAVEDDHLRASHIALSSAYSTAADAIEAGTHIMEKSDGETANER